MRRFFLPLKTIILAVALASISVGGWHMLQLPPLGAWDEWRHLPVVRSSLDTNGNGVNDTDDIILGAREEAHRKPIYRSAYYQGGYPPFSEGVCTDVVWRSLQHVGYDLKALIDADIKANPKLYPRTGGKPDPNIDFRRVPNLLVFFKRHAESLTTVIAPHDPASLGQWQGGDIVIFTSPDHVGILSDKRNKRGVPLLIHNSGPWAREADDFIQWYNKKGLAGHFRFPAK